MSTKGYCLCEIYQNQNKKEGSLIWTESATTTNGVATFNPTNDNTASGNAIFTNIYSVLVSASSNTSTATSVPVASIKLVSADKKTITMNCINGIVLAILGATTQFSADGTTVYCTIIGD